jgi:hypothetical protein
MQVMSGYAMPCIGYAGDSPFVMILATMWVTEY